MYTVILCVVTALGCAIVLLLLVQAMIKRGKPVNNTEITLSTYSVAPPPEPHLLQRTLFLVMVVTLILGIWVRLTGAGWNIIIWGIPLMLLAILHFGFQVMAIRTVSKREPPYILLILFSNLFLFLGFALQADAADAPGYYLPIAVFFEKYFYHGSLQTIPDGQSSIYMDISIGFLIALIVSWFFLLGKSFLKQENDA